MIPQTPENQAKIALWRQRAADGSLTPEDCKEFVLLCRQGRMTAAASATTTKRAKAIAAIPKVEDVLGGLDDL